MRARNIKPGFFTNDRLAECSMAARLLFAGLWTIADREGRLEDRPKRIRAEVLPYDEVDCEALLSELAKHGFITRYASQGNNYIQVLAFAKHQNPHVKEAASTIPAPDLHSTSTELTRPLTDSLLLIPSSLNPIPDSSSLRSRASQAKRVHKQAGYSPGFEIFWSVYPRHDGSKAKASELYEKAITEGITHDELTAGARAYAEYVNRNNVGQKHVAHTTTWLGGRRWESDYSAERPFADGTAAPKSSWKSAEEQLRAKILGGAQPGGGNAPAISNQQALRPSETIRQDSGRTGDATGGIPVAAG